MDSSGEMRAASEVNPTMSCIEHCKGMHQIGCWYAEFESLHCHAVLTSRSAKPFCI
jgi:hypothetical protein